MHAINIRNILHLHGRQIIVLFLLAILPSFFTFTNVYAQKNLPRHDSKWVHFGISLGVNRGHFQLARSEAFTTHDTIMVVDSPWSPGFNIGIVSDLHLGKHADLRFIPTLMFAEKDLRYIEVGDNPAQEKLPETIESIILGFPLYFKYKSDRIFDNFRFYGIAGGRVDWDLASNSEARQANDIVKINSFDFSIEYGVGLEFYFPLFIFAPELRISQGIPNIHFPTDGLRFSDVLDNLKSRYIMISFQFEG